MTVAFRQLEPADRRFVIDSWATSYKTSYTAGLIQMGDWFPIMDDQLGKVLDRPDVITTIAYETDADSDHEINGYLVAAAPDTTFDIPYVYYCFVKTDYRRKGVARALFRAAKIDPTQPFVYACRVPLLKRLERHIPMARWNPLPGRFPKEQRR